VIAGYLRTATQAAEDYLGRALITSIWEYKVDHFPPCHWDNGIRIPLAPVQAVTEITYLDTTGAPQVLDPERYAVTGLPDAALITTAPGQSWPTLLWRHEAVTVSFVAGYGDSWNNVPEPIRTAIGEQVRNLYDGCGNGVVEHLLQPYRMWPV
jgi:uncharacterized phiE125 gp8 family phage protein